MHLLDKQKAEEGLSICYQQEGMLKKGRWVFFISFIASEDADIHVLCYLENEAVMSNNITRCMIASCSDRQLQYEPVQTITEIYNYFSVTGNSFNFNSHSQDTKKGKCYWLLFSFPPIFACFGFYRWLK